MQIVISYDFNFLYLIFFILQMSEYELQYFFVKNKRYNSIYFYKKYENINVSNNQKSC